MAAAPKKPKLKLVKTPTPPKYPPGKTGPHDPEVGGGSHAGGQAPGKNTPRGKMPGGGNVKTNIRFNPHGRGDPESEALIAHQDELDRQQDIAKERERLDKDVKESPSVEDFLGKMKDKAAEQQRQKARRGQTDDEARARADELKKRKPPSYGKPLPPPQRPPKNSDNPEGDEPVINPRGPSFGRRNTKKAPAPTGPPPIRRIPRQGGSPPMRRPPIPPIPNRTPPKRPGGTPPIKAPPPPATGAILRFLTTKPRR